MAATTLADYDLSMVLHLTDTTLDECGEVVRGVMFDASFAQITACGIDGVIDAVFFVVVDADEAGSFGEDGGRCVR